MTLQTAFLPLADLLLKGAAVLIVATIFDALLRRASSANRSALWSAVAVVLLLLPVTLLLQPRWSWMAASAPEVTPGFQITLHGPQPAATALSPRVAVKGWEVPNPQSALVVVWFTGAILLLVRRFVGTLLLQRLKRRSISAPVRILELAHELAASSHFRRTPRVALSESAIVPLTWGTWRPVVMLPAEAAEWPEEMLRIVLRHEYAHIARHDSAFRLFAQIACAIHWLNPLVWAAARKLRLQQEQAADDLVLAAGVDPLAYADELVACVRRLLQPAGASQHALAMAQPTTMAARIGALLDKRRDRRPLNGRVVLCNVVAILLILTASALAQVAAQEAPTPGPAPDAPASPAAAGVSPSLERAATVEAKPQQPKRESAAAEKGGAPSVAPLGDEISAAALADFSAVPIKIDAESTSFTNGIAQAFGAVKLTYRNVTITADWLDYDPKSKAVTAHGNVTYIAENGNKVSGTDIVLEHNLLTQWTKVTGNHEIRMKDKEPAVK